MIDVEVVFREISLCILFSYDKRERERERRFEPTFSSTEELKIIIELSDFWYISLSNSNMEYVI